MAYKTDSQTKRNRLAERREPYWDVLGKGQAIGFRRGSDTWVARFRNEAGQQQYESLGVLADYPDPERFEVACKKAREWFAKCRGGMSETVTVTVACDEYLEDLRLRKGPRAEETARVRIKAHIEKPLGGKRVDKLTLDGLKRWRDKLVTVSDDPEAERASKNSANRTLTVLKAVLNHSARLHRIVDRSAWADLKPFSDVAGVRDIYLTSEQKTRLLEASGGALLNLIKAGFLTGARLSELTTTASGDFDPKQGTLHVNGKTGERFIVLSDEAIAFFKEQAKDKTPKAWLLPRNDGSQWDRYYLSKRFREVAKRARLPTGASFYSLRHWYISQALQAGIDIELLARNVGNSAQIIRRHYHKFLQDDMRKQINKLNVILG